MSLTTIIITGLVYGVTSCAGTFLGVKLAKAVDILTREE